MVFKVFIANDKSVTRVAFDNFSVTRVCCQLNMCEQHIYMMFKHVSKVIEEVYIICR